MVEQRTHNSKGAKSAVVALRHHTSSSVNKPLSALVIRSLLPLSFVRWGRLASSHFRRSGYKNGLHRSRSDYKTGRFGMLCRCDVSSLFSFASHPVSVSGVASSRQAGCFRMPLSRTRKPDARLSPSVFAGFLPGHRMHGIWFPRPFKHGFHCPEVSLQRVALVRLCRREVECR